MNLFMLQSIDFGTEMIKSEPVMSSIVTFNEAWPGGIFSNKLRKSIFERNNKREEA